MKALNPYHHSFRSKVDEWDAASMPEEEHFFRAQRNHEERERAQLSEQQAELHQAAATSIRCPKCQRNHVRFTTQQVRRADEGMTVRYVCQDCGHNWSG